MQRWHVMAFGLILAAVGPIGCAVNTSPGDQVQALHSLTQASAFLTAVDVDVLDDHTLVVLQSESPLHYTLRREEAPSRLVIDLPMHKIAPGVRPLQVFRGGVTGIYLHQGLRHGGSQVEIGLHPSVSHSYSLPFATTLLVEIRSDT